MGRRQIAWKDELEQVALGLGIAATGGAIAPFVGAKYIIDAIRDVKGIQVGIVVTYNPQTHTAAVFIMSTRSTWTCTIADEHLSYSFGFSESHPAREGDLVLVYGEDPRSKSGRIIGRVPYQWNFSKGDKYRDPDGYNRNQYTQLENTRVLKLGFYGAPLERKGDDSTHLMTNFRPTDIYPGEYVNINQHNCGIKGGLFSASLMGGGAILRMSALTNAARLSCDSYTRNSLYGSNREFHNGRYLSSERDVAIYQEERLGGDHKNDKVWTDDSEEPIAGENQTMRPRMKELSGYFGNISAKFCLRPDPDDNGIRVQGESMPNEEGVARETIDPSGQYRLSAAGMIAIERTGRIPVPVRIAYPTDKNHDISSNPEKLEPFEHKSGDPGYRQLELFDRQAYDLKNQYARVDGLGLGGDDKKDHYVPQEEELKPLTDSYDIKFTGSNTVNIKKFDKRRAGIYIGEDGSVIVRDAWGSEIVMLGGNITFSCAGNIMNLPGRTSLTIAGDDIVQKAQNSIDIHASEHDVRVSASRNIEILGGADEKEHQGGVIIESRGKGMLPWDGKEGESAHLSGITLKTKSQGVVIDSEKVLVRSRKKTSIISGDRKIIDGSVDIAAKNINIKGRKVVSSSRDGAYVKVQGRVVESAAGNINLHAEEDRGFFITKGMKTPIPLQWTDIDENIASKLIPTVMKELEYLDNDDTAFPQFDFKALDKMIFQFRSSSQCGTKGRAWTIGGPKRFRLYEPAWAQVMKIYETLNGIEARAYKEDAEWETGMPFPGKESEEGSDFADYAMLSGSPVNLTFDGFNISRKLVRKKSSINTVGIKEYLVRS